MPISVGDINLDWNAGDPEAGAALNRYLRLVSAQNDARGAETKRVVEELLEGGVGDPVSARTVVVRLAWLLHIASYVGQIWAVQQAAAHDMEELDAIEALEAVMRREFNLDPPDTEDVE